MIPLQQHVSSQPDASSIRRFAWAFFLGVVFCLPLGAETAPMALFSDLAAPVAAPVYLDEEPWRAVHVAREAAARLDAADSLTLHHVNGESLVTRLTHRLLNPSGSVSWVGKVEGDAKSQVVLVQRDGIVLGSIRSRGQLTMLAYSGTGQTHFLYGVDESSPKYQEMEPTSVPADDPRWQEARQRASLRQASTGPESALGNQDDGSIQDLLVVYTPRAESEVGGTVAMENLIDLGVTETNLSYAFSGVDHRVRLVGAELIDFDEQSGVGCPRDPLQDPNDGVMDEVHPLRDAVAADLVKLIVANGGGCGRAFIMNDVSVDFEAFAFCWTNHICVSPGYTFQHELGHIQAGRHQRTFEGDDSPFTFNHGYTDPVNEFRTIMAAGSGECPDGCPRQLAWSNPDVLEPNSGAPMGIPEGDPLAADNRKTLNATAFVVANFRISNDAEVPLFADGFESGNTGAWVVKP